MIFSVQKSQLSGSVPIPGSKSHTIRALAFALLAEGESVIEAPLVSSDTLSCKDMIEQLGAVVSEESGLWRVKGVGRDVPIPDAVIDVGNSGTSLYIGMGIAALIKGYTVFTGDHQIRNRPADGLLKSLENLGAEAQSTRRNGKPPLFIGGPLKGGKTSLEAVTSQYLTALLIAAPLGEGETHIDLPLLNEKPYVTMTLRWLDNLGINYTNNDYKSFVLQGGQEYKPFRERIAADFSSATFFCVAAAITGTELELTGLDFEDSQGDKEVVDILKAMGASVNIQGRTLNIGGGKLAGGEFDLNAIPDALPALAVAGCFAKGETRLVNVPQARLKETDRIAVMCAELKKMGADIEERPDGLIIRESTLKGAEVDGHHDHRIVMAMTVAACASEGTTKIHTAESAAVTFPNFRELMTGIGARIVQEDQ